MGLRFVPSAGDDLISIATAGPREAQSLAKQLRNHGEWLEVVAGIASVVVRYDIAVMNRDTAQKQIRESAEERSSGAVSVLPTVEIPVVYGGQAGADLGWVCARLQLTEEEFIALHTASEYEVDMLGFTPGFAYIGPAKERLSVPRLTKPRVRVAAGSVGIAEGRTGLYALPGPGGWPVIGQTSLRLFDAASSEPFVLQPGMKLRFVDVGRS